MGLNDERREGKELEEEEDAKETGKGEEKNSKGTKWRGRERRGKKSEGRHRKRESEKRAVEELIPRGTKHKDHKGEPFELTATVGSLQSLHTSADALNSTPLPSPAFLAS